MALIQGKTSSIQLTNKYHMFARVNLREDYSVEENYSIVTASMDMMADESEYVGSWLPCGTHNSTPGSIIIGGETVVELSNVIAVTDFIAVKPVNTWVPVTKDGETAQWSSGKIYHNDDGSGVTTVESNVLCAIPGGGGKIFVFGSISKREIALTTIPRKSTITSASAAALGKACGVSWTPKADSFRYKLVFSLGGWSGESEFIEPHTTQEFTYSYTIPMEVANQLPSAASGVMTVTLYTYTGDTEVGSDSATFEVTVPDNTDTKPTIAGLALEAVDTPFPGVFVQAHSKVKATLNAAGRYGAEIVSTKLTVEGNTYTEALISKELGGYGDTKATISVTDSRGFTATKEEIIYVCPYSNPSVKVDICERCEEDGILSDSGTFLRIDAARSYSKVIRNETQHNYCTLRYRYAKQGEALPDWQTMLAEGDNAEGDNAEGDNSDSANLVTGPIDSTSIYVVEIGVVDRVGITSEAVYTILTEAVFSCEREGGDGMAYGMYSQGPGFDMGWDARFHKDVTFHKDVIIEGMSLRDYILSVVNDN